MEENKSANSHDSIDEEDFLDCLDDVELEQHEEK